MFPTSIDGEFEIPEYDSTKDGALRTLLKFERALFDNKAKNIKLVGTKLTFEGGIMRMVSNWNILVPVGYGEIEVRPGSPGKLIYRFSTRQMLAGATGMAALFGLLAAMGASGLASANPVVIFLAAWAWLFGMNYLFAAYRLPRFVRSVLEG